MSRNNVELGVSNVFKRLYQADTKMRVLEGGSGSSKTWSIIQWILQYCRTHPWEGKRILVTRQKLTWLKLSALSDFEKVLRAAGVWERKKFNKSESSYELFGNTIYFTGLDEPQKVHGPRWDIFWGNEAIELGYDDCRQVMMRTNDVVILDYNPSVTDHWIYDRVIPRDDCTFIRSTQLDNPFLPENQRKEILAYEPTERNAQQGTADQQLWEIYGLGLRANIQGVIFPNVNFVQRMPQYPKWTVYGLDFGYVNDPTALIKVALAEGELYFDQKIYEPGLVNIPIRDRNGEILSNISDEMARVGVKPGWDEIYADSAEQKSIMELSAYSWLIYPAKKGPDSVINGIDILKRYRLNITESSLNFKKEAQNYKWTLDPHDKEGKSYINKPIDRYNHCWDAARYVAMMKIGLPDDFQMTAMN